MIHAPEVIFSLAWHGTTKSAYNLTRRMTDVAPNRELLAVLGTLGSDRCRADLGLGLLRRTAVRSRAEDRSVTTLRLNCKRTLCHLQLVATAAPSRLLVCQVFARLLVGVVHPDPTLAGRREGFRHEMREPRRGGGRRSDASCALEQHRLL